MNGTIWIWFHWYWLYLKYSNPMIASKQKAYISISCKLMLFLPANCITRIVNHTVSSWSTRWRITRIWLFNTEIVFTNISMLTIRISSTFRSASSNSVWLRNQSLLTSFFLEISEKSTKFREIKWLNELGLLII